MLKSFYFDGLDINIKMVKTALLVFLLFFSTLQQNDVVTLDGELGVASSGDGTNV